jgi:hypothetical protein
MIVKYLNICCNSPITVGDGGCRPGTAKALSLADNGRAAIIHMLEQDGSFCCRPQPLDGTVETTDHDVGGLLGEVYSRDYLRHELWHPYL